MYVNKSDCYCYCKTKKHPLEDLTMLEVALAIEYADTLTSMIAIFISQ